MSDDDLSDEQVQQLLKDAEQRLRDRKRDQLQLQTSLPEKIPQISAGNSLQSYITKSSHGAQIDTALLVKPEERELASVVRKVEDPVIVKAKAVEEKKATAGSDWYNLPKTDLTPELKRDLQLLRMRDTIDPKRFYKKDNKRAQIPEYSQVGTIIQGPTEYFNARLTNKERKRTFVEEVMAGEIASGRFKSKYNEIQVAKTSGRKGHYKKMSALRRGSKR